MDVVAEVVRSGFVESRHRGTVVRIGPAGEVIDAVGDPDVVVFPRSVNKPIQALAMLRGGLDLDGELLALAMASHSAEPFHVAGVDRILAQAGLDRSALQTPSAYPMDPKEHAAVVRAGGTREPIYMDCSGKHAAMLLTCVANSWPSDNYLDPQHPLQVLISQTFEELTAERALVVGTDGCGAPLLGTSLRRVASAVGAIASKDAGSESHRLADAWSTYPQFVSGHRRAEYALMRSVAGLRAKTGAESVYVAALADDSVIAVKIEDGAERALDVVMRRALQRAGVTADLTGGDPVVLGGGVPVGSVTASF